MSTVALPPSLIEEVKNGKASLFLGAGASVEANFPTAYKLGEYLAKQSRLQNADFLAQQPLDEIVQHLYFQDGYGKGWVRNEIIQYFDNLTKKVKRPPSVAHNILTRLRWRTIFTTNYDRLVELAYDTSADAVQRVLPIYSFDAQILRHESERVRLIKLNGSVDEAARNSKHELVLTFAEQQDALSRNKELYHLLYEEAINGPIILLVLGFLIPVQLR
jgi:hypothetical protein